jgi:5'-3' exonuclease
VRHGRLAAALRLHCTFFLLATIVTKARCYLIDTNVYAFGVWKASPHSYDHSADFQEQALTSFSELIARMLQVARPHPVQFIFDGPQSRAYRQKLFPAYKANRPPTGPALRQHLQDSQLLLELLGLPVIYSQGYEADDVIGHLARELREQKIAVTIITADKDLMQLIKAPADRWWDFQKSVLYDARGIEKRFGVPPTAFADFMALTGDRSDNIPGIPGLTPALAARLLKQFGNLDNVLANQQAIEYLPWQAAKTISEALARHRDELQLFRQLTKIVEHLEPEVFLRKNLGAAPEKLRTLLPQTRAGWQSLQKLEKALYECTPPL